MIFTRPPRCQHAATDGLSTGVDPGWLSHYQRELSHLRESAAEFAREFPQVAGRLALEGLAHGQACPDPHVERLLEGFAFLAARVHQQIEAAQPRFTGHLLERLLPHHAAPMPALAVVALEPEVDDPSLAGGPCVPAGAMVCTSPAGGQARGCRFRVGHAVRLWPLHLVDASLRGPELRLRLAIGGGLRGDQLALDELDLHLAGEEGLAQALHALLVHHATGVSVVGGGPGEPLLDHLPAAAVMAAAGLGDDDASLWPELPGAACTDRLLKEYAACPARFLFVRLHGLHRALGRCHGSEFELHVALDRAAPALERAVDASSFALHATPVLNLHRLRADRVLLDAGRTEFRLVVDRAHPADHEVHALHRVTGMDRSGVRALREFRPLHESGGWPDARHEAGYALRRAPRQAGGGGVPGPDASAGAASTGRFTDVWLSLSDPRSPPWPSQVTQLAVEAWCTDHDRPSRLPPGDAAGWRLDHEAPVRRVRCLRAPTRSMPPLPPGRETWALLAHLTAGLEGLLVPSRDPPRCARALRELLALFATDPRSVLHRQALGVVALETHAVVRRVPVAGPAVFARGLSAVLTVDDEAFAGTGPELLGAVLHRVFASRAPVGSFVELALHGSTRGPLARWPARAGEREGA